MAKVFADRWEVIDTLGEGGQAHVFRVRDLQSPDEHYALKRLRNPERMDRFEREIKVLRELEHKNIISVVTSFVEDDTACYVMPLMEGGNLKHRVESYKGDIPRSLELVLAICDAVQAAHAAKIIHRDLKPENILFRSETDDAPVVADFGICYLVGEKRFTETRENVGPRFFMAPELERGKLDGVDASCDVYSLGKLLYYVVTGGIILAREYHRERDYDLRQKLTGDSLVSVRSCQLEYVSRLLDDILKESESQRWPLDRCITKFRLVQRLVAEGRYPITGNMPCRFCGEGEYHLMPAGSDVGRFSDRRHMCCELCGHVEQFFMGPFDNNASIGGPPKES